jgi:hypothetical protein
VNRGSAMCTAPPARPAPWQTLACRHCEAVCRPTAAYLPACLVYFLCHLTTPTLTVGTIWQQVCGAEEGHGARRARVVVRTRVNAHNRPGDSHTRSTQHAQAHTMCVFVSRRCACWRRC